MLLDHMSGTKSCRHNGIESVHLRQDDGQPVTTSAHVFMDGHPVNGDGGRLVLLNSYRPSLFGMLSDRDIYERAYVTHFDDLFQDIKQSTEAIDVRFPLPQDDE